MKLQVPFYKQKAKYDCGPTALQMVLNYLGDKHYSKDKIQRLVDSDKSGVTWTVGLAKTAAQLGFTTEFYTSCLGFNPKNYELEFYKKTTDGENSTQKKLERLKREAVKFHVELKERKLTIEEILNKIDDFCIPIVLLDWSKIKNAGKFTGHFVPIVGYDSRSVYLHNQGEHNPQAYLRISRNLFDRARKSPGTDEDIIFIHKK
jgi:hypothetical protein